MHLPKEPGTLPDGWHGWFGLQSQADLGSFVLQGDLQSGKVSQTVNLHCTCMLQQPQLERHIAGWLLEVLGGLDDCSLHSKDQVNCRIPIEWHR